MHIYFITFRSVTSAQRGENLLRARGYRCIVQRTPRWMQENGCGYCIRVMSDRIQEAKLLLDQSGLPYRKIYRQSLEGGVEETFL